MVKIASAQRASQQRVAVLCKFLLLVLSPERQFSVPVDAACIAGSVPDQKLRQSGSIRQSVTHVLGAHPIVQNDGPLSVKRAFTAKELEYFGRQAGLPYLKAQTHFGYRLTLAGEKR